MTREEIIRLAREAGLTGLMAQNGAQSGMIPNPWQELFKDLNRFEFKVALVGLAISLIVLAATFLTV
jgi:hypothetical protein